MGRPGARRYRSMRARISAIVAAPFFCSNASHVSESGNVVDQRKVLPPTIARHGRNAP